jgi:hypothetical protein
MSGEKDGLRVPAETVRLSRDTAGENVALRPEVGADETPMKLVTGASQAVTTVKSRANSQGRTPLGKRIARQPPDRDRTIASLEGNIAQGE